MLGIVCEIPGGALCWGKERMEAMMALEGKERGLTFVPVLRVAIED